MKTSNYRGTEMMVLQEFKCVVKPDLAKQYAGGHRATKLDVYLLAVGATRRDNGRRLDKTLDEIAGRISQTDLWCEKRHLQTYKSLCKLRTLTEGHSLHNSGMVDNIRKTTVLRGSKPCRLVMPCGSTRTQTTTV